MKFSRTWLALWFSLFASLLATFATGCLSDDYRPGLGTTPPLPDGAAPVQTADGSVGAQDAAHPDAADAAPATFTIHGTVTGLSGKGLVIQDNGGDNLAIAADGPFVFSKAIKAGGGYSVSILTQPSSPTQTCAVANGTGTATADVNSVAITCTTQTYPVGGTVTGVTGSGLVLAITVNGKTESVPVAKDGTFAFPTNVASGSTYTVVVQTNPTSPSQTCTVAGGSGVVVAGAVTTVVVNCATNTYVIGGSVSGLAGQGLVLANGTSTASISANGTFAFAAPVASGASYAVTVATQPASPSQTCTVAGGTGVVGGANVTTIAVTCGTNSYPVGGSVTGLAGTGLVLTNGNESLSIPNDGAFVFTDLVASGGTYDVSVQTQPTSPWQTCAVTNGSGVVGGAAVTNVQIACTTSTYTVGGTVSGLTGAGLVVSVNGGDPTPVNANGNFTFAQSLASGAAYDVAVQTQPSSPTQTCTVANGQGTVAGSDVANVAITCSTNAYAIGGTITGLTGSGLVLKNGVETLTVGASDTAFTFATLVPSGNAYDVTVSAQPSNPTQTCAISGGQGTVVAGAITSIVVNCATNAYVVGGTVSGLAGSGLVLRNGTSSVAVSSNGSFAFATPVQSGTAYDVTVGTQPSAPTQSCTVTNASGVVGAADVTSIHVTCATTSFAIGGAVSNLAGSGLVLQDNGADDLAINASGGFTFATRVASGAPYAVTVRTQPTNPWQTCAVSAGAGTVGAANITNVGVDCTTNRYSVGGSVNSLVGAGLTLTLNGGSLTPVTTNGVFTFPGTLASGTAYTVAIASQPTNPTQTCTLTNPSGTVAGANVTNVVLSCATNRYPVGGTIAGLAGAGLILTNGSDSVTIPAGATTFTFPTTVASGQTYNVQVATQPSGPTQSCTVSGGQGTVVGAPVTSVAVNCATNSYTLGGTVSGLAGSGLVLRNGNTTLPISANGNFAFSAPLPSGTAFAVTVGTQPSSPTQTCTVTNGTGAIVNANVTSVAVACSTNHYTVGGTVTGLAGTGLVLRNNGGDDLAIGANGAFTFATSLNSGTTYAVTVRTAPTNKWQTCTVTNGSGTVGAANVTNVQIACTTNSYTVSAAVTGLAGTGLSLALNGGSALGVTGNGTFTFATAVQSGNAYAVTVQSQPSGPTQSCTVTGGTGTMAGANVTVNVSCATSAFTIGGTVSGLVGNGLTLTNAAGLQLPIAAGATTFTFPGTVASGSPYVIQIASQPTGPSQTCTISGGQGTVGGSNVTSIVVNCSTNQYAVSGTITGLAGTGLRLSNGTATINASGTTFAFPALPSGTPYNVTVATPPSSPTQSCTVTNGAGTLTNQNVSNVVVACTTQSFSIAVKVTGLKGIQFKVSDATDTLTTIAQDGTYTFPTPRPSGTGYTISFPGQPHRPEQTCSVTSGNGQGIVGGANITVGVTCVTNKYVISVPVSPGQLTCPLTLSDGTDTLNVTPPPQVTTSTYNFPALDSGTSFTLTLTAGNGCWCGSGNTFGPQVTFGTGALTDSDVSYPISCFAPIP